MKKDPFSTKPNNETRASTHQLKSFFDQTNIEPSRISLVNVDFNHKEVQTNY